MKSSIKKSFRKNFIILIFLIFLQMHQFFQVKVIGFVQKPQKDEVVIIRNYSLSKKDLSHYRLEVNGGNIARYYDLVGEIYTLEIIRIDDAYFKKNKLNRGLTIQDKNIPHIDIYKKPEFIKFYEKPFILIEKVWGKYVFLYSIYFFVFILVLGSIFERPKMKTEFKEKLNDFFSFLKKNILVVHKTITFLIDKKKYIMAVLGLMSALSPIFAVWLSSDSENTKIIIQFIIDFFRSYL